MIEEIYKLSQNIFEDEISLGIQFRKNIHEGNYKKAQVITEAMKAIYPMDKSVIKLDKLVVLCIKD